MQEYLDILHAHKHTQTHTPACTRIYIVRFSLPFSGYQSFLSRTVLLKHVSYPVNFCSGGTARCLRGRAEKRENAQKKRAERKGGGGGGGDGERKHAQAQVVEAEGRRAEDVKKMEPQINSSLPSSVPEDAADAIHPVAPRI